MYVGCQIKNIMI